MKLYDLPLSPSPRRARIFAAEKGIPYETLRKHAETWVDILEGRREKVADMVADRMVIDHAQMRIAVLQEREPLRVLFMSQVERWLDAMADADTERVELRELTAVGNLLMKMAEIGAGLPKEHVVRHDEVHEEISANRHQMTKLENAVLAMAEWKRERRRKTPAKA